MSCNWQDCGDMLIGSDDHNASCIPINTAKIIDVVTVLRVEHFFIVAQPVFAFCGPQVIMQIVHGQIGLLEDGVGINDGVDIGTFRRIFRHGGRGVVP